MQIFKVIFAFSISKSTNIFIINRITIAFAHIPYRPETVMSPKSISKVYIETIDRAKILTEQHVKLIFGNSYSGKPSTTKRGGGGKGLTTKEKGTFF